MAPTSKIPFSQWQQAISTFLIMAMVFPLALGQAPAQQPQQTEKDKQGLYRFRVESELVLVNVVVRDKQGKLVTDLTRDDFTVLEDGKPQRVASFDSDNLDMQPIVAASGPTQESKSAPAAPVKPILTAKDADQA